MGVLWRSKKEDNPQGNSGFSPCQASRNQAFGLTTDLFPGYKRLICHVQEISCFHALISNIKGAEK
jgi:hypothetical protein